MSNPAGRSVALLTLGCARNEVDSEELAARLSGDGWRVSTDVEGADVVLVNTCGFVEAAKRESVDTLLAAADTGAKVVATGCLAERYGRDLAKSLPEADAVLGFDHYPDISARLSAVLAGERVDAHAPRDRRTLLPLAPAARRTPGAVVVDSHTPAHLRPVLRRRLTTGPAAPLKLASGCDRRCSFCAIPSFRGAFVSRTPDELLAEAHWLAGEGVRELVLVSENSTSYGKDLGDPRLLEKLLPQLAGVAGIARIRVSYLQPAETRPSLVEALATTPGVAAYFDLSFQHASGPGSTRSASSATATKRAPRRRACPARSAPTRSGGGTSAWSPSPRSCAPSGRRSGSARPSRCWSTPLATRRLAAGSRGGPPNRPRRSTARPRWWRVASTWPGCGRAISWRPR